MRGNEDLKNLAVSGAHVLRNREGADVDLSSCISFVFFFRLVCLRFGTRVFPPGELPLRYPVGLFVTFFSKSRAKLSS